MQEEAILNEMNLTVWAYELVDELLKRMVQDNGYSIPFSIDTEIGNRAIDIIKHESLATCSNLVLLKTSLTITQKGKDVIAAGGIEKYLGFWDNEKSNRLRN